MSKVYIVNRGSHDFGPAEEFGDLVILSDGPMDRYGTNNMYRVFKDKMKDSSSKDYIVPCSLNVMNIIAGAIFSHKHGRLNLLLFSKGRYLERNLVM